jgi:hypothetical protein
MKKLNVYASGIGFFEQLIVAAGIDCLLTLGFFRGWRRRSGNHPFNHVLKFRALQSQIYRFCHTQLSHRLEILASQNHLAAFRAFGDAVVVCQSRLPKN